MEKANLTIEDIRKTIAAIEKLHKTIVDLQKTIGEVNEYTTTTKKELQEKIQKKPLESAGILFIAAIIIGILIGSHRR